MVRSGPNPNHQTLGVLAVIGGTAALPFGATLAAELFGPLGTTGTTIIRLFIAGLLLTLLARPTPWRWSAAQWKPVILLGFGLSGYYGLFYYSIARIPLGVSVALEFIGPLLLATVLARSRSQLIWVGIATAGIGLLGLEAGLGVDTLDLIGVAAALAAGGFWVIYILATTRVGAVHKGIEGLPIATFIGGIILLPFGATGAFQIVHHPQIWLIAILMALFSSVIPVMLELFALRHIDRGLYSVLVAAEPVFATAFGWLIMGQTAGIMRLGAIGLIIIAMAGSTWHNSRTQRAESGHPSG